MPSIRGQVALISRRKLLPFHFSQQFLNFSFCAMFSLRETSESLSANNKQSRMLAETYPYFTFQRFSVARAICENNENDNRAWTMKKDFPREEFPFWFVPVAMFLNSSSNDCSMRKACSPRIVLILLRIHCTENFPSVSFYTRK